MVDIFLLGYGTNMSSDDAMKNRKILNRDFSMLKWDFE